MTDNESTHDPADTPPSKDDLKKDTSRISLESARAFTAKKATGPMPGMPAGAGPIPQTIRLKRPPTSPITVQPVDLQAPTTVRPAGAEPAKRQTSRVGPVDAATKSAAEAKRSTGPIFGIPLHAGPIPQTIRLKRPVASSLKRPSTSSIISSPTEPAGLPRAELAPGGGRDIAEAPTVIKQIPRPTETTSRIVLEDILPEDSAGAKRSTTHIPPIASVEPLAPKTIRLKRPSSLSDAEEAIETGAGEEPVQAAKKAETSKIELPSDGGALAPLTQRKTIKIKRTDRAGAPRPPAPAAAPTLAPQAGVPVEITAMEEDTTIAFPLVACAAALCIAALVYIMAAQALGVNLPLLSSMQLH